MQQKPKRLLSHRIGVTASISTTYQNGRSTARSVIFQIALLLLTIELVLWSEGKAQSRLLLLAVITLVVLVIASRAKPRELGIGLHGIGEAMVAIPIAIGACSMLIAAAWMGGTLRPLHGVNAPVLHAFGYAAWAFEQQFLLNSFFYRRFEMLFGDNRLSVLVTATLFSLVHIPNPVLVPATFFGGLLFVELFRRYRNIYPLAVAHALFGLTIAMTFPDAWIRHMRVGLGFLRFQLHG